MKTVAWRIVTVAAAGLSVLVSAPSEPTRPVLVCAVLAVAAAVLAAATGWRAAGTVALSAVALAVLVASAFDPSGLRPLRMLAAGAGVLVLVGALDRSPERSSATRAARGAGAAGAARATRVTVLRAPAPRVLGPPAVAVGAAVLVAVTAAQDVEPSVRSVLFGIVCAVAALAVTTRVHRN